LGIAGSLRRDIVGLLLTHYARPHTEFLTVPNYMEHHLGPELDAITSFTFTDPTLTVTRKGHMAYGYETYGYRIELEDGRVIERDGVATSVLSHDESGWKIVQYHSSSRAPRRP